MAARFTYSTKFDPNLSESEFLAYLHVNSIGNVHLPLSIQNSERLVCVADPIPCGYGLKPVINIDYHNGWYVNEDDIFTATDSCFLETVVNWVNIALALNKIDGKAIGVRANLKRLVMYPVGGHCKQQMQLSEESGHFATLRVQLPVQGGYSGGVLTVKDGRDFLALDHSRDSNLSFYFTIIHAQTGYEIAEVTHGFRVELIFNLLWTPPTPSLYPDVQDITPFIVTLSKLHNDLTIWCAKKDEEEGPVRMLMIRLDNAYEPEIQLFSSLTATDRFVAYLFRSLNMLEIHLAYLTRKTRALERNVNSTTVVGNDGLTSAIINVDPGLAEVFSTEHVASHWVDVNDCAVRFSGLNIDAQVEDVDALIDANAKPNRVHRLANDEDNSNATIEMEYSRNVLVVWPKSKQFQIMLNHRFDYQLHLMEIEQDRDVCLTTLRAVLLYEKEWPKREDTVCKLLNIARRLQAGEEALQLLNMLTSYYIGVCSEDAAILIARTESEVLGWLACQHAIVKLLNINQEKNLKHFTTLARHLFNRGSFFAFQCVVDETWQVFLQSDGKLISSEAKVACARLLMFLEDFSQCDYEEKGRQLIETFRCWDPVNQCNLLTDLEDYWLRNPAESFVLFKSLASIFVQSFVNFSSLPSDLSMEFFDLLLNLYDEGVDGALDIFANCLSQQPAKCFTDDFLAGLVTDFERIDAPPEFFAHVLDARILELNSKASDDDKTRYEQKDVRFPLANEFPDLVTFFSSNERCIVTQEVFGGVKKAREFALNHFEPIEDCVKLGYSAIATVAGYGKKCKVRLVKTLDVHRSKQQALKKELKRLVALRQNLNLQSESTSQSVVLHRSQ